MQAGADLLTPVLALGCLTWGFFYYIIGFVRHSTISYYVEKVATTQRLWYNDGNTQRNREQLMHMESFAN